ncbi:hypothetical protein NE615_25320, partial [Escherichia coli]|nr:hypothetical protein [Escherichia coli]
MMKILRDGKINIYEYINKEQLEKLNPPEDLRTVIEKLRVEVNKSSPVVWLKTWLSPNIWVRVPLTE